MSASVWPMLLDISKEECKRLLRRFELEAYASLMTAFRAQGDLTKEKKKVLQDVCTILGISTERHRAEVRRAVNDERLATVADVVGGCSDYSEWIVEGRRLVPLMPRLVPQTAFTDIANVHAIIAAQQNSSLPPPSATKNIKENLPVVSGNTGTVKGSNKVTTADIDQLFRNSPQVACQTDHDPFLTQHEVVVSTSIADEDDQSFSEVHPVNLDYSQTEKIRKRRRTSFNDPGCTISHLVLKGNMPSTSTVSSSSTTTSSSSSSSKSTLNIPIGGTPVKFTLTGNSQKVKLNTSSPLGSMHPAQKVFLVSTSCANIPSNILQRSLTVSATKSITGTSSLASTSKPTSSVITPISSSTPVSLVLSGVSGTSTTTFSPATGKSLKIIAQSVPVSSANKLGSKVSLGGGMPPIVVVTKTPMGKASQPGTRLVNIIGAQSVAGKSVPSLVSLGTKGKQAALVKVAPGMSFSTAAGGKPNVYVVQKSRMLQQLKQTQPGSSFAISASPLSEASMLKAGSSIYKEGFKHPTVVGIKSRGPITSTIASSGDVQVPRKSSVLADLLQAAGIFPDGATALPIQLSSDDSTDLSNVSIIDDDSLEIDQQENAIIDISSLMDQLKGQESISVPDLDLSDVDGSSELIVNQPASAKTKLTKLDGGGGGGGGLNSKTGLFAPFTVKPTNDNQEGKNITKKAISVCLETIIQGADKNASNLSESSTLRRELLAGRSDQSSQSIKTSLYKGATYSKGDIATHRKKVTDCLLPEKEPTAASSNVQSQSIDDVVCDMDVDAQEVHFTDDNLTAVIEETVVTTDEFPSMEVKLNECNQDISSSQVGNIIGLLEPTLPLTKTLATRTTSTSGSSVFMVSDSSFCGSSELESVKSTFINQEGVCDIESIEGGAETLEIIGSTEDLESVESRVAALHGGGDTCDEDDEDNDSSSKRKKSNGSKSSSTWYRWATGLMNRIMKFRGPNRFKTELAACRWFLNPVSADEAPGYLKKIKKPMDFSTILKKLETLAYKDMNEFNEDVLLVKQNCELYNPDGHPAREDCKLVFAFYEQEYNKLLQKMKAASSTPPKKRAT